MSRIGRSAASRWHRYHQRRWEKALPLDRVEERFRRSRTPYATEQALDRVMLGEFVRCGARHRGELAAAATVRDLELPEPAVSAWMETARRRGLIVRTDGVDVHGSRLPEDEWEIAETGRAAYDRAGRTVSLMPAVKAMRIAVPLVVAVFTLMKLLFGDALVPSSGVAHSVHLPGFAQEYVVPLVAGFIVGMALALVSAPIQLAGRSQHLTVSAARLLARKHRPDPDAADPTLAVVG